MAKPLHELAGDHLTWQSAVGVTGYADSRGVNPPFQLPKAVWLLEQLYNERNVPEAWFTGFSALNGMGLVGNGQVTTAGQESGGQHNTPTVGRMAPGISPPMKEFWRMAKDAEKPESR
ncbi:hypothetical protein [Chloracidobacterium thermophilum]|uniref:hypothetical protein n=1 Tax=Chloracidobacterium thermophilum TaxID=458033 RepID=UPI000738589E|nr:hypothetical protein [Chloracidobacterium thermophilum]